MKYGKVVQPLIVFPYVKNKLLLVALKSYSHSPNCLSSSVKKIFLHYVYSL